MSRLKNGELTMGWNRSWCSYEAPTSSVPPASSRHGGLKRERQDCDVLAVIAEDRVCARLLRILVVLLEASARAAIPRSSRT